MVAAAASVGFIALVGCFQCLVAVSTLLVVILGGRFASVQVEATPRVDVQVPAHLFRSCLLVAWQPCEKGGEKERGRSGT